MFELLIALSFIFLDIATGLIKAWYNKSINSSILRKGLFHKLSEIFAIGIGYLIDFAEHYYHLGININLSVCVMLYICIMEIVSVIENLCYINPQLMKLFKPYLQKLKSEDSENDSKN